MKKYVKLILVMCVLCLNLISKPVPTLANTNSANFGVEAIYPENQEENKEGYFSLLMKEGQQQVIKVKVTNYSDQPNTVKMLCNRATTSDSGLIEYNDNEKEPLESDMYDFNKIVKLKTDAISLAPNESKDVEIDIKMEENSFEGIVLGGVYFYEDNEISKEDEQKNIRNTFSYSVPILLKNQNTKVDNQLALKAVSPIERNSRPFIEAQLVNSAPTMIKKMSVEGRIYNEKNNEEYYVNKETELEMAPNSIMNFGFDLQNSPFISGKYRLELKINADGKEYDFKEYFTIDKKQANELNEKSVYVENRELPWTLIVIVSVSLIIVSVGVTIVLSKKKKKKKKKKNNNNRKIRKNTRKKR